MSDPTDVQNSMMTHMELRGLRPRTVSTFTGYARRFLAQVGKAPAAVTAADVESFLLNLCRKGRAPRTRNVALAAVRCLLCATTGNDATVGIPRAKVPRLSPRSVASPSKQGKQRRSGLGKVACHFFALGVSISSLPR